MNYVRTSSGGMMPIKRSELVLEKKQTTEIKPARKTKKASPRTK